MASLRFHKVSSLPASCALGDVYYVVGKGIYVCTTAASSGASESVNYTRFSYANDAASGVKGVTSLSDAVDSSSSTVAASSKAVKAAYDRGSKGISDAATVQSNLDIHTSKTDNPHGVTKAQVGLGNVTNNAQVKGLANGTTSGHFVTWGADGYTVADSGYAPGSFDTKGTAATEAGKVLGKSGDAAGTATVYGALASAAAAQTAANSKEPTTTAVRHGEGAQVGSTTQPVYVASNGAATACTYTLGKSVPSNAVFTDTHNKHTVSFTNGNAGDSTGDSVVVVTGVAGSTTGSDTTISASTTRTKVPTLAVTNGLATRISSLETLASTGMQYKGSISSISTTDAYVAGSVYRVVTNKISLTTSQSATGSAITAEVGDFIVCSTAGTGTAAKWDVWQANVNKDAYWDTNNPANNQIVIADGTTGKIKTTGFTTGSFDTKGAAADVLGKSGDAAGTATVYGALASAAAAQTAANSKEPTSTAVRHTADTAVGSAIQPVYVASNGAATACTYTLGKSVPSNAVFTDTHYSYSFTINDGQSTPVAAQTFAQSASKTLAIKAAATGNLTASTVSASKDSGTLTINVGVAQNYAIPSNTQISQWDAKWKAVDATTSSKGIASFNSSNFAVSSGAVSLVWATWPES